MNNLDDSENNVKISDSAYSNSCSNSQSRRSRSSKSTLSGSNSSRSSGYGGKPSTSSSSNQPTEKRIKEKGSKKKKQSQIENVEAQVKTEIRSSDLAAIQESPKEEKQNVDQTPSPALTHTEKGPESMELASPDSFGNNDKDASCNLPMINTVINFVSSRTTSSYCSDGFSCVISMHDGVVMYTTSSLTSTLGFPKDMWIGRSFIDFVHPRDRSTFASQITNGLAVPKIAKGTQDKVQALGNAVSTLVCRIRRYRGLTAGFGVKERIVTFMPFLLKLSFKKVSDEEGEAIYLVIQATPFSSAFKVPNEIVTKPVPFVMRHTANGNVEYIDPESVPYLGYLPQEVIGKDALQLYHPDDLYYLSHVYETIVKEGAMPRSKPYRMLAQNGNYVKLETEWSSFINPWSRKLEFIIGKHHILQGPNNPDVFDVSDTMKCTKLVDVEQKKQIRDTIIKIMNEVLTKPAEAAKQQMTKRCQDLTCFIESLMEEQPKIEDELRLDIQDPDHSYYERDSLLGGISPHHDYNDSTSSIVTPISYNQLNYNENLQRYFESHQSFSYDDYNTVTGENVLAVMEYKSDHSMSNCQSSIPSNSGNFNDVNNSSDNGLPPHSGDYQQVRLTESLLNKHNSEMEKELFRAHRESRSSTKGEREKTSNENRQKKKEHLARCNASFQPAAVLETGSVPEPVERKTHGVKRSSKHVDTDTSHKHHCPSPRQVRRRQTPNITASATRPSATVTTTFGDTPTHMHTNSMNNMNTFFLGVGIPQQMSIMSPVLPQQMAPMPGIPAMPGTFPMYYTAAPSTPMPGSSTGNTAELRKNNMQFPQPPMQCMMYGQPMYGSPFMYSPVGHHMPYPLHQTMMAQSMQFNNSYNTPLNPLGLTSRNYEEACKPSLTLRTTETSGGWRKVNLGGPSSKSNRDSGSSSSNNAMNRSTEAELNSGSCRDSKSKSIRMRNSDGIRTDGESSYSSFYSSFFKTESGSAEESSDMKRNNNVKRSSQEEYWERNAPGDCNSMEVSKRYFAPKKNKKIVKKNMNPPWTEQVCVTSELIYKYQVLTKTMEDVLLADKQKISTYSQPPMVNEQLGQLYLDLQLEGVASRLTLEEGITSSSSSGEDTPANLSKKRRKREYSKLVMIYDEDAPLPPPTDDKPVSSGV